MLSIYKLKPAFQGLLRPIASLFARAGVTANQVTVGAAGLSFLYAGALLSAPHSAWLWLGVPLLLFVRMALNAIDGMLAREWNQKSQLGAMLNELCDIASDTALLLPFAVVPGVSAIALAALVGVAALSEAAGLTAQASGGTRRYDGPFGKSDRAVAQGALCLAIGFGVNTGSWITLVLWILCVLGAYTTVNRVRSALREMNGTAA